jgi:hypothetical protein
MVEIKPTTLEIWTASMESKPRAYLRVPNLRIHYARSLPFIFLMRPPAPVLGQSRDTHDVRAQSHEASVCRCPCRSIADEGNLSPTHAAVPTSHAQGWRRTTRRVSRSSSEVISSLLYLRPWFVSSNPVLAMASLRRKIRSMVGVSGTCSSVSTANQSASHLDLRTKLRFIFSNY